MKKRLLFSIPISVLVHVFLLFGNVAFADDPGIVMTHRVVESSLSQNGVALGLEVTITSRLSGGIFSLNGAFDKDFLRDVTIVMVGDDFTAPVLGPNETYSVNLLVNTPSLMIEDFAQLSPMPWNVRYLDEAGNLHDAVINSSPWFE